MDRRAPRRPWRSDCSRVGARGAQDRRPESAGPVGIFRGVYGQLTRIDNLTARVADPDLKRLAKACADDATKIGGAASFEDFPRLGAKAHSALRAFDERVSVVLAELESD
jgi:hypothetical protein